MGVKKEEKHEGNKARKRKWGRKEEGETRG